MTRFRGMHDRATIGRFIAVGGGAALLLFLLTWLLAAAGAPPFVAGTAAYATAFFAAYLTQRGWSFRWKHAHRDAFPRYVAAQTLAALISGVVAHVCMSGFGLPPEAAALLAACAASGISFLMSLFWVFPARLPEGD